MKRLELYSLQGRNACQENILHTITQPAAWTVDTRGWIHEPWIHAVYTKFWPYHLHIAAAIKIHQTRKHFSSLLILLWPLPLTLCFRQLQFPIFVWTTTTSLPCVQALKWFTVWRSRLFVNKRGLKRPLSTVYIISINLKKTSHTDMWHHHRNRMLLLALILIALISQVYI